MTDTTKPTLSARIIALVRRVGAPSDYPAGGALAEEVAALESSLASARAVIDCARAVGVSVEPAAGEPGRWTVTNTRAERMREALDLAREMLGNDCGEVDCAGKCEWHRHVADVDAALSAPPAAPPQKDEEGKAAEKCAECGCPRGFACHISPDPDLHEFKPAPPPLAAPAVPTAARSDLFPTGSTVEPTRFGVRVNIPAAPESTASASGEMTADYRDCTCVSHCKGVAGMAKGWRCQVTGKVGELGETPAVPAQKFHLKDGLTPPIIPGASAPPPRDPVMVGGSICAACMAGDHSGHPGGGCVCACGVKP